MRKLSNECVAQCPTPRWHKPLFVLLIIVTVGLLYLGMSSMLFYIVAIGCGVCTYLLYRCRNMEYEYALLEDELNVDKIIAKSARKHLKTFYTDKIEIIAPVGSKHLTPYASRQARVLDYSGVPKSANGGQYEMYYDRQTRVLLTLSEGTFNALRLAIPGKVLNDDDFCIY